MLFLDKKYGEHVNDHQLDFCRKVVEKWINISVVENVDDLYLEIENVKKFDVNIKTNNFSFNDSIINDVKKLFLSEEI